MLPLLPLVKGTESKSLFVRLISNTILYILCAFSLYYVYIVLGWWGVVLSILTPGVWGLVGWWRGERMLEWRFMRAARRGR